MNSGRPEFGQWQRIWRCDSPGIRFARSAQSRSPRAQGDGLDCSPLPLVVGGAWRMRENVQVVRGSAMKFLFFTSFLGDFSYKLPWNRQCIWPILSPCGSTCDWNRAGSFRIHLPLCRGCKAIKSTSEYQLIRAQGLWSLQ